MTQYLAASDRYEQLPYNHVGRSGLRVAPLALGLWHNFGDIDALSNQRALLRYAFDHGITHFDMANNYGPSAGSAESNFGQLYKEDFKPYRDELVLSSKAGFYMWPGPYGEYGSRKYIIASADQSLRRTGLDYFDIFYSHRYDPNTPLEETAEALDHLVRQGKALYIGISNYGVEETAAITKIFRELKTPYIIHQDAYNMFHQEPATSGLFDLLEKEGTGAIVFSPLAQGQLTDRYLNGIPDDSRAVREGDWMQKEVKAHLPKIHQLNAIAQQRGQSLAEMALAWDLQQPAVMTVLIGASKVSQLEDNLKVLDHLDFTEDELKAIDDVLKA
ncbi:aldo/keto reductase [Lacticaseibacillus yichunensis]|uniref:Aldo/keto reductase n=1 Tax=Lacticaseibacillus yichunensis TaxID=2486015 RepID=A0ABW4CMM1_9LACO|nr:aldo/keto reductase [Lacticaseibacillus yichunensis]